MQSKMKMLFNELNTHVQKIMKLVFKSGVWKASIKSRKVPSIYMS